MQTIYQSGFETALGREAISSLEEILQTRFLNIASFLSLNDDKRIFETLVKDHSIITAKYTDGTSNDYAKYPLSMFPPLHMFITEDKPNTTFIEFKVDNKKIEVPFIDWPDLSETFITINEKLTNFEFVSLDLTNVDHGAKFGEEIWFMAPKNLDIQKLCEIVGYSTTRPLDNEPSS